ncbi:putative urea ABC transporter substrate-binding protein [Marinimicrobium alkaliphilum]|uniref:putative urea ABC transporter substrate-binding protein n=1 Tax=Marinimicrobium alkaliphilum TaxID=2202654 RepID=UPI000DB9C809|nr:putative urea ABC transporter substrate-binding protein [Marinimicrobium alkaliphilum]
MKSVTLFFRSLVLALSALMLTSGAALADDRPSFKMAWTIYAGWMPWAYADEFGIVDKWADKYGIKIEVIQFNDYIESINQFTAGDIDACGMTNMDALTIPAASGVDTTGLILGDYSNGNDGILLKSAERFEDIRGREVHLVELSVSHYLLARGLDRHGMSERDVRVVNTSDADAVSAFMTPGVTAAAIWNPQLSIVKDQYPNALEVFDSSQIPGEIIDMMAVKTEVLEAHPELGKALVGAWLETLAIMRGGDERAIEALTFMAEAAGTSLENYQFQLTQTELFYTADTLLEFSTSDQLSTTMDLVRQFSFEHGLLGDSAPSPDVVGIQFPDDSVLGNANNIKLRFDPTYVQMAADGEL